MVNTQAHLGTMTPAHPQWREFYSRLGGLEGCNGRYEPPDSNDPNHFRWECDAKDTTLPKTRAILRAMGASNDDISKSVAYFHAHCAQCDCEVLLNVQEAARPERLT